MGGVRRSAILLVGVGVLASSSTACSNHDAPDGVRSAATTATPAVSTTALANASIDRKTRRPDPDATAVSLSTVAVRRAGDHDQAVLTFSGNATPGWAVQYVDAPTQNGTGQVLKLPGNSWLEVLVLETPSPFTNPASYAGPEVVFDNDVPQINTVRFSAQAAGITQLFVNINGARPDFAVSSLSNPTRIVIDVAD